MIECKANSNAVIGYQPSLFGHHSKIRETSKGKIANVSFR